MYSGSTIFPTFSQIARLRMPWERKMTDTLKGHMTEDPAVHPLTPRQAFLLEFLGAVTEDSPGLDPVRIVKGCFVISQASSLAVLPEEAKYSFIPYDYGPFSREIYDDLDRFRLHDFVATTVVPGRNWRLYRLSEKGKRLVEHNRRLFPWLGDCQPYIGRVYHWVSSLTFPRLLKSIYTHYPQYAVNSIFKKPR